MTRDDDTPICSRCGCEVDEDDCRVYGHRRVYTCGECEAALREDAEDARREDREERQ